jgi:transcriptional regulator with XRE-family HTH domain
LLFWAVLTVEVDQDRLLARAAPSVSITRRGRADRIMHRATAAGIPQSRRPAAFGLLKGNGWSSAMAQTQPHRRRGRARIETPNPIDVLVGTRLRLRRNMLGLSQERLGEAIGLTFQQVQKYERGANRIGASRLHELSQVLNVPVSFFFDDTDPVRAPAMGGFTEPSIETFGSDPLRKQEMIELVRAYLAIENATVRQRFRDLLKALVSK